MTQVMKTDDINGQSPLHLAAIHGHTTITELLLQALITSLKRHSQNTVHSLTNSRLHSRQNIALVSGEIDRLLNDAGKA